MPDGLFGNCFDSQSSLRMCLYRGNVNLLCVGKHAPELGMVDNVLTRVASRFPGYSKFLESSRLRKMGRSETDYQEIHAEEMFHLLTEKAPPDQRCFKVKPLSPNISQYDPNDFNTLHVVFNIEGAHMFYDEGNDPSDLNKMIEIFNSYNNAHRLLYVTVAHLTPNVFANHADGNKILPNKKTYPSGKGISDNGDALIAAIYNKNVLVDVKHMSWVARQELFKLRADNKWAQPLIASHAALTGFKASERFSFLKKRGGFKKGGKVVKVRHDKKKGLIPGTYFNPNSINLYDEEVVEILKSKGLIGINFDKRILGASEKNGSIKREESEFISEEEAGEWKIAEYGRLPGRVAPDYRMSKIDPGYPVLDEDDLEESRIEFNDLFPGVMTLSEEEAIHHLADRKELHLKFFCNQLLKIKDIFDKHQSELVNVNVWDHICMGSDFDGLISTIHCCRNITEVEEFAKMIHDSLPIFAKSTNINLGISIDVLVDKIFFQNAYDFLMAHFHE